MDRGEPEVIVRINDNDLRVEVLGPEGAPVSVPMGRAHARAGDGQRPFSVGVAEQHVVAVPDEAGADGPADGAGPDEGQLH
jgi:hypothetical protein